MHVSVGRGPSSLFRRFVPFFCGHLAVLAPLVEEIILPPLKDLGTLVEIRLVYFYAGLFLDFQACSFDLTSILILIPHCSDHRSFVVSCEIGKCESSNCTLLFQDYLAIASLVCD